jgi:ArsR family transcriptional regulator, arsenate/arsenite/antimonite-responsive transcriptional repressor
MAINKKNEFGTAENQLADFANAISHPARIAILKEIAMRQTCICGEIVEVLPLAQSTVSQHLKELLKAGLITGTVDGVKSCYCINWQIFGQFEATFKAFFANTNAQNTGCC